MIKSVIIAAFAAIVAIAPAQAQNLVTNGSFETGDFTGWTQVDDTSFTGVDGVVEGVGPPEGEFQAFFGPLDPGGGGILQDLKTVAGGRYEVTFSLAHLGGTPNAFRLFWDGGFVSIDFDLPPFEYTNFTRTLTASGTTTTLGFNFYSEPSFYLLDAVSAESIVPEPATWGLMIVGFGLTGAVMRRRKVALAA